jgi:hypothetical protein
LGQIFVTLVQTKVMKYLLLPFPAPCLTGRTFNKQAATAPVKLAADDIALLNRLNKLLLRDKQAIRKNAREYTAAVDTFLLSANSHYLYKTDKAAHEPLVTALQQKGLLNDGMRIGHNNTVILTLKST